MIIFLIATSTISACNVALLHLKRKMVKEKTIQMFEDNGYEIKKSNKIFKYYLGNDTKDAIDNMILTYKEKIGQFIPVLNLFYVIDNILYLNNKPSTQKFYDNYFDWSYYNRTLEDNIKPIEMLKENEVIKDTNNNKVEENNKNNSVKQNELNMCYNLGYNNVKVNHSKLALTLQKESK